MKPKPTKKPKPKREGVLFVQVGAEMLAALDQYAKGLRERNPWTRRRRPNRSDAARELLALALRAPETKGQE